MPHSPNRLYHVSDHPDIPLFEPRPPAPGHPLGIDRPAVWAIGEQLLHNYLLPRDCPRVTFHARADSDPADVDMLLGRTAARHVVAIESGWLAAVRDAKLYLYEFSHHGFELVDEGAGYYISYVAVRPVAMTAIADPLGELARRSVELRITPSLWPLHDAVAASSLQFSIIRMRNARPR